jgi:ATP-dependent DNA helicase RecQ
MPMPGADPGVDHDADPQVLLRQHFGFDEFRDGQRPVIEHLLAGRSAAAVFPTGGGKSLCYQLPALALPGVTLVVSPLIALMKDQIDALTRRGIPAARMDSSMAADTVRQTTVRLQRGQLRLLYVAPERFNNERFRELLTRVRVSLFAVDEAHCISEWGHNFRPDYLKLASFARKFGAERVLALTATATPQVLDDIRKAFEIAPECAIRTGFYRPNLTVLTTPVDDSARDALLLRRLAKRPAGPTIVYVTTQKTAEAVAEMLAENGHEARHYHAGMKPEEREAVQEWFLPSQRGIVCATIAFGMGIDKPDIRYVYHYNLPKSLEGFAQEIGRAGRDGEDSTCEMLVCRDDLTTLESFASTDAPTLEAIRSLLAAVFGPHHAGDDGFDVSLYELSRDHGIKLLVVRTLLTYLELLGMIEGGTPFYATFRFRPRMPSREILAAFEGDRRAFLAALLRQARKGREWFTIDASRTAAALRSPRERVVAALDYLGQQGMLEVTTEGLRNRYRMIRQPDDIRALAAELHRRAVAREHREIERLHQVVQLSRLKGCQIVAMCRHFGEERAEPCGHCTWCLKRARAGRRDCGGAGERTASRG